MDLVSGNWCGTHWYPAMSHWSDYGRSGPHWCVGHVTDVGAAGDLNDRSKGMRAGGGGRRDGEKTPVLTGTDRE